jgi:photosystem II stability/assembly factor-like uncharacterized protein
MTWHEGFDPQYIFDVAFTDTGASAIAIAVGAQGRILRSADRGQSWSTRTSPTTRRLHDVDFPTPTVGYAVGELGTVIKTTDAGLTWLSGGVASPFDFNGVSFVDANTGTIVGANGAIFRTTSGGGSWIAQNSGTPRRLNGVDHIPSDPQQITAVGDSGAILRSTNGGLNWVGGGTPDPSELTRISFFDNNRAAIVGEGGRIYLTTNGGTTWLPQTTGVVGALHGVAYYPSDPQDITAVGADGIILRTTNGGATWAQQTSFTNNVLRGIAVTRTTRVAAGAGDNIRRSTNSGASWSITTTGYTLRDVCIVPGTQEVWAVGDRSTVSSSTVFYSSDAGVNWMTRTAPGSEDFSSVRFINNQYGYMGSASLGRVYRTTNGGTTWINTSTPPPMVRVFDLAFKDSVTGHAVGASGLDGRISFTTNAGTNWTSQAPGLIPLTLRGIAYFPTDPDFRTAVGDSGAILHTTNLGSTWMRRSSGTTRDLEGVAYASASHVYAVGDLGTIVRSADGGAMWSQQPSGVTNTLYDVAFISRDTGFVVGNSGLILGTTTGGVVAVEDPHPTSHIPERFVLEQNYPNPFNPTTTIHYSLPPPRSNQTEGSLPAGQAGVGEGSLVTLRVYDLLGREVATLVNSPMQPGTHGVFFHAGTLSSGVYLYRLTVGGFAEVKKMAVVR